MGEHPCARERPTGIVLHDFMAVPGGAEKLTAALLTALPGTDLCVGYVRPEAASLLADIRGALIDLGAYSPVAALKIARVIRAFARRAPPLEHYPWAVFSGNYAPLAIRQSRARRNVLYCHTPPRFCYDLREHYREGFPRHLRPALDLLVSYVEPRYRASAKAMDLVVANSRNVQGRLGRFLGVQSVVIPPPIDVAGYRWLADGDYYLSTARLEPLKRVQVIVEAFVRLPDRRLVVASGGEERARLEHLAAGAPNIRFTGWLAEAEMRALVGHCRAVIYIPRDEDFGMSPVEAMAAGKPVIGVAEGGLVETVRHGRTGLLIAGQPGPEALRAAVDELERLGPASMRRECERAAAAYDQALFIERMMGALQGGGPAPVG